MAFTILAVVVALACIAASARRVWLAADATALDPRVLLAALRGDRDSARALWSAIKEEIAREPAAAWERDLVAALETPLADTIPVERAANARVALVNEQLGELDFRAQRWARVPRVCASISTSFGFLLASLALRNALAADDVDVDAAVVGAINVAVVGLAGAIFCVASQARARALVKERNSAVDKLVERLEALTASPDVRET